MGLLTDFMEATNEAESPRRYFYWAFLSAISAVVGNNIYIKRGNVYITYPAIYVLLVGKSGLRKGVPISIAKTLVEDTNLTRVISGRITTPALIKELATARSREDLPPLTDAVAFLAASEFASFIVDSDEGLTTLTDLYDGHYHKKEWTNILKGTGTDRLKNVNITMLGAINQVHYNDIIQPNAIGGGFIARTFIILEHKPSRINALVRASEHDVDMPYFVEQLVEINKICRGEATWSKKAGDYHEDWYEQFRGLDLDDKTGTLERLHEHIIKTAMLLAFSEKKTEISFDNIEEATLVCSEFSQSANKISINSQAKTSALSPIVHKIAEMIYISDEKIIGRKRILQKLYPEGVLSGEIDTCLNTLVDAGFILAEQKQSDLFFRMPEEGVLAYNQIFKEK